jgi:uncharacterized membrane protein
METVETDHLVDDYLRRLEHAAAHMQRARRAELVAEIRGHIETALRQEEVAGEAAVRNVLDRLGPPEEIVEAAEPPPPSGRRARVLEILALVALVLPIIGWLIGTVLVLASQVWSRRDKLIGALLLLLPVIILGLGFVASGGPNGGEASPSPGETLPVGEGVEGPLNLGLAELVFFVPGVPSALFLAWRLRRSSATSHPTES